VDFHISVCKILPTAFVVPAMQNMEQLLKQIATGSALEMAMKDVVVPGESRFTNIQCKKT
jgi:hypothetical protein